MLFKDFRTFNLSEITLFDNISSSAINPKLPQIIFTYGLVCSPLHFRPQIEFFANLGYPVCYYHLRGHYQNDYHDFSSLNFANFSHDLHQIVNYYPQYPQKILVGHSMGVNICLKFSETFPNVKHQLILISGTTTPPQSVMLHSHFFEIITPWWEKLARTIPGQYQTFWENLPKIPLLSELILRGGFNSQFTPKSFVNSYLENIAKLPPELFFQCFNEMQRNCDQIHLDAIQTKALIIAGIADQVIPLDIQLKVANMLPNSELYLVQDGSHVPQIDFPDMINETMLDFIREFSFA